MSPRACLATVLASLLGASAATAGVLADPSLEAAVRRELGNPSGALEAADLTGLTSLSAPFAGVESLEGLEHATNLVELDLFANRIADAAPLAALTGLETLNLGANELTDAAALAGLSALRELNLAHNQLTDTTPLAGLALLERLDVTGNALTDPGPLEGLEQLRLLRAGNNAFGGSLDVSAMALLEELSVENAGLSGIEGLEQTSIARLIAFDNALRQSPLAVPEEAGGGDGGAPDYTQWTHVALTLDGGTTVGAGALRLYVDGEEVAAGPGSQLWPHAAGIGAGYMNNQSRFHSLGAIDNDGFYLAGQVDALRLYDRTLSATEVAAIAGAGPVPSGAVAFFPLDSAPNDVINAIAGTLAGGAALEPGFDGNALSTDGLDDGLAIANSVLLNETTQPTYTVSLWFRADNPDASQPQVLYEQGGRERGLNLYLQQGRLYGGAWNTPESGWSGTFLTPADEAGHAAPTIAWLYANPLDSFGPQSALGSLRMLYAFGAELTGLPPAEALPLLTRIDVRHNRLPDSAASALPPGAQVWFAPQRPDPLGLSLTMDAPGVVRLDWTGQAGLTYVLYRAFALNGEWERLGAIEGTDGPMSATPATEDAPSAFFQVYTKQSEAVGIY